MMVNTFGRFVKDPQAKLDYAINWSQWLNSDGDTISASTWSTESGITIETDSKTDSIATVWLSGGEAGRSYKVTNHIVTQGGRENEFSIVIVVQQR